MAEVHDLSVAYPHGQRQVMASPDIQSDDQLVPSGFLSCSDDERLDLRGVCWVCNVKRRNRSSNRASAVPTVGAVLRTGSDERPQRPKAGLMAASIESK